MELIKLTKKNTENIDCNEVAFYSYAESGAMGRPGDIEIVTFDNKKYRGDYYYGVLNIENFYRVLPSLEDQKNKKNYFSSVYLGMGNHLFVRNEIYDDFIKIVEKEIPTHRPVDIYNKWLEIADNLLKDYKKPSMKRIKINKKEMLNPFYSMGLNININDRTTQDKIIKYVEKNAINNLDGYNYKYLNAYSKNNTGIQFNLKKIYDEMTLTEKVDNLVIHHTNNCVWKSDIETNLANEDEYIIRPHVKNAHGMALIKYINADTIPYIYEGKSIVSQINCFAYDLKVFKNEEKDVRGENSFHFYLEDKNDPIYLADNSIVMCPLFTKDLTYNKLNLIRGEVLEVNENAYSFLGEKGNGYLIIVDTEFGPTPIVFNESVISYINGNEIRVGDVIEAICSITGDIMLVYEKTKTVRDSFNYYDVLKKAIESKNMSYLKGILSDDCEFISDTNHFIGKKEIINRLQNITYNGYKDKQIKMEYATIIKYPVTHFPIGREVLCLCYEDNSVEGEFCIHVNKKSLVDRIYLTNDSKITFKIYRKDGSISVDDNEKNVIHNLIDLLIKRDVPELSINIVLRLTFNDLGMTTKLLNFIKERRIKGKKLVSDIYKYQTTLFETYFKKHPHRKDILSNYTSERPDYKPVTVKKKNKSINNITYVNNDESNILEVITDSSNAGFLKAKFDYNPSIVKCDLILGYGDLNELDMNSRESLKDIDLYKSDDDDYTFNDEINDISNDLKEYKCIRIWTKHNSINDYLLPYYFINKFYNKIKNKEIKLVYIDEIENRNNLDDLLFGEFDKIIRNEKILTKEEIKQFNDEWKKIKKNKCDIRNIKNNQLVFNKFEDYFNDIIKLLSKHKVIRRKLFFGKLITSNMIKGMDIIVFNHLIDLMIEKGLIESKDYEVSQFLPNDNINIKKNK